MIIQAPYDYLSSQLNPKNERWTLIPLQTNGNVYVEIKLHSIDVITNKDTINFEIKILVHSKSVLPKGIILASAAIPEKEFVDLNLVPIKNMSTDNNWTAYSINFSVSKKELSYGNQNLKDLIVPLRMNFYPNNTVLKQIQNQLETRALKEWMQNLHDSTIDDEIKLDSYFRIHQLEGTAELYKTYPSQNTLGETFQFSWNMNYFLRLQKLNTINELFSFTTAIETIISNIDINIYYHVPNTIGHKQLSNLDKQTYMVQPNTSKKITLPFKVQYNLESDELFKEPISGHDFFLPKGGSGYYHLNFDLKTDKTFYNIAVVNQFQYMSAMDTPQLLDYFTFEYNPIYSLNGFDRV